MPARHSGQAKREPESSASLERLRQLNSRLRGNDEKDQTQAVPVSYFQLLLRQLGNNFAGHVGEAVHAAVVEVGQLRMIES